MKKILLALVVAVSMASYSQGQIIYSSDFEADDGGWTSSGDWQWGTPVGFDMADFGGPEPVGGHSGDNAWGTIIGGAHNPSTNSVLNMLFDLSGSTGTTLTYWEWIDSGGNAFDTAEVIVNGDVVLLSDGGPTADWREINLDLSAYDGNANVDVSFVFDTTGVVERVGWYIDDVTLAGAIPEPASTSCLAMFLGAVVYRRRRRA